LNRYRPENNFIGPSKYLCRKSMMTNAAKSFDSLAISLNDLHNYFDSSPKLFSGPAKFLDTSAKPFFTLYYIAICFQ